MAYRSSVFPGIPLVESPVFDHELYQMDVDEAEREIAKSLNRNGYAIIDFPDPDLDDRIDRICGRLAPQMGVVVNNSTDVVNSITKGRIQDAWQHDEDVRAIAANAKIIDLLSRLYGRQAFPFQTLNFPIGTQQHLHTDAVHFSSVPERFMCGVWLAMEDIDTGAGPLCYVPGSHKWPIISNAMIGRKGYGDNSDSAQTPYHDAWNAMAQLHDRPIEHLIARKGQALIWTANLLHGGSLQTDPGRTRWSQVTHYFFDDCVYYTPAFSDEMLGRLALREIVSAADGTAKPNIYLGEKITPPKPATASLWRRTKRAIGKAFR